jgi:intein/homing endonuclease
MTIKHNLKLSKLDQKKGLKLPNSLTDDLAYICGVLAGDGGIYYREKKKEYYLQCAGNPKDERKFYDEVLFKKISQIFGIIPKMKLLSSGEIYGFRIYSKTLYLFLTEVLGLPSGDKNKSLEIPEFILKEGPLLISYLRGVFDTDGCICFKRKKTYPVISLSSKSDTFISMISQELKKKGFQFYEVYNYKTIDPRIKKGYTIKSIIEICGIKHLEKWMNIYNFYNPKHLKKIKDNYK